MKKTTIVSLLTLLVLIPATLFLGTHLHGRWYYLTSTLVVLEAMASKRVVVGYRNGGIVEMVVDRKTGYIEEIGDVDSVSHDIEEVYLDRKLYENIRY